MPAHRRPREEDRVQGQSGLYCEASLWPQLKKATLLDTANTHATGAYAMANTLSLTHSNRCQCYSLSYKYKNASFPEASHFIRHRSSSLHWGFCCHLQASSFSLSVSPWWASYRKAICDRQPQVNPQIAFFRQNKAKAQFPVGTAFWTRVGSENLERWSDLTLIM